MANVIYFSISVIAVKTLPEIYDRICAWCKNRQIPFENANLEMVNFGNQNEARPPPPPGYREVASSTHNETAIEDGMPSPIRSPIPSPIRSDGQLRFYHSALGDSESETILELEGEEGKEDSTILALNAPGSSKVGRWTSLYFVIYCMSNGE